MVGRLVEEWGEGLKFKGDDAGGMWYDDGRGYNGEVNINNRNNHNVQKHYFLLEVDFCT